MILIFILYALLALSFVIAKAAVLTAKPIFLIAVRMILAGGILLSYLKIFHKTKFSIAKTDIKSFLSVALFHIYLAFIPEFWALQYLTSSKTNIIYSITPFVSAFIAYYFYGQTLTRRKKVGMFLGVLAILPVLVAQYNPTEGASLFKFSLAEVALLIAVVSAAYAWFIISDLMAKNYSLVLINGAAMLIGGFWALLTSFIFEIIPAYARGFGVASPPLINNFYAFGFWVLLLILISNVIVYNLYGLLIKKYSITFLTLAGFLCPAFGAILGYFIMGEPITWHYIISLITITIALYVYNVRD